MKKYRFLLIVVIVGFLGAAGAGVYAALQMDGATRAAAARTSSMETVDAFIAAPREQGYTNELALELMSRSVPEVLHSLAKYTYQAPEGFAVQSLSEQWKEDKLKLLYEELKKNKHGEELAYLFEVVVYPQEDEYAMATHESVDRTMTVQVQFPALVKFRLSFSNTFGVITLYGGDTYTTIESMAHALSHEYGHHYTLYHMFEDYDNETAGGRNAVANSEYARLRDLSKYPTRMVIDDVADYKANHHWYAIEIAAEDYVQLMGSPTLRHAVDIPDVRERLNGAKYPEKSEMSKAYNAYAQENLMIPLAIDVVGLSDYFHSFIGEKPAAAPEKKAIDIQIKRGSTSYNLTTGNRTFVYYNLTWNTPYEGASYTLVCYDESEYYIYPIKTVEAGKDGAGTVGTVTRSTGSQVYWYYDNIDKGKKTFYVLALLPDGTVMISNPLTHQF